MGESQHGWLGLLVAEFRCRCCDFVFIELDLQVCERNVVSFG